MSFITIPERDLEEYRKKKGSVVIDLRSEEEFQKKHIDGAENIPYEYLEKNIKKLGSYKLIIFICERGGSSMQAARSCDALGLNCATVAGGMNAILNKKLK